jgi:hypothetical protein
MEKDDVMKKIKTCDKTVLGSNLVREIDLLDSVFIVLLSLCEKMPEYYSSFLVDTFLVINRPAV